MIYLQLFFEFCKIGLLALGGGLATVPFLYDLTVSHSWFTSQELTEMIAVSESTPGPLGVNMATYAGFRAAGVWGGLVATLGLIMPSMIIIILLARYLKKHSEDMKFESLMKSIRPVSLALISFGGIFIARDIIDDYMTAGCVIAAFVFIHKIRIHPILYIISGAVGGLLFA